MIGPAPRRAAALIAAVLLGLGLSTVAAPPAAAAGVGYVRLAHLSPDTPAVDVYLSSVSGTIAQKMFPAVGYGSVSQYMALPVGTYAVAMRSRGAAPTSPPVLAAQANVAEGKAYTVAGVGRYADLGLRVLTDDLTLPTPGQAKVRVVQASVRAPSLDVAIDGGQEIASGVPFASTTAYASVQPGRWTLRLRATGEQTSVTVTASLSAGAVYSLIVLDRPGGGLSAEVRTDAKGSADVPNGGVNTGAGGTRAGWFGSGLGSWGGVGGLAAVVVLGVVLLAAVLVFTRIRSGRLAPRRRYR